MGFPLSSAGTESACNIGDIGLIPGLGRAHGEGNGNPLQCSCLENPMDRGAWKATVPGLQELDSATKQPPRCLKQEQNKKNCTSLHLFTRIPIWWIENKIFCLQSLSKGRQRDENIFISARSYHIAQETLLNVMWQPGWAGSLGENGYMYMCGWVPLLSTWNYHNIVNQLYSNTK